MGKTRKVVNVVLRVSELICAAIVCGIMGHYLSVLDDAHAKYNSRIVYTVALASLSIAFSLVLLPPYKHAFYAFPLDFSFFIMWMVCFGLLVNLSGGAGCDSYWVWNSWGYYWGGWWRTVPIDSATSALVGTAYCSNWRATVAFVFIGGFVWLFSGCLGIYALASSPDEPTNDGFNNTTLPTTTITEPPTDEAKVPSQASSSV